jgi:hypothetical protein
VLARQVLYHLSHALTPFYFSYLSDRVSHFFPRPALDYYDPSTHAFCIAGITVVNHNAQLVCSEGCPGCP